MTIQRLIAHIEEVINASSIVLSSDIRKFFSPLGDTVYFKGRLIFIDLSILDVALYFSESNNEVISDKYRFHYMNSEGRMLFRYDNAPHHPQISTFPHHKHVPPDAVVSAHVPSFEDILNEISSRIISQ